jgi:hypothetical protein
LPVTVTTFQEALSLSGGDFIATWEQLSAQGQEVQEVLSPSKPINPEDIQAILSSTLRFSPSSGLPDESEFVLYGAASLRTGAVKPSGEKVTVGCLAKIEMNVQANAMRVTVRTTHPAASTALMFTAKMVLL